MWFNHLFMQHLNKKGSENRLKFEILWNLLGKNIAHSELNTGTLLVVIFLHKTSTDFDG